LKGTTWYNELDAYRDEVKKHQPTTVTPKLTTPTPKPTTPPPTHEPTTPAPTTPKLTHRVVVINDVEIDVTQIIGKMMAGKHYVVSKWTKGCLDGGHVIGHVSHLYRLYPSKECHPFAQMLWQWSGGDSLRPEMVLQLDRPCLDVLGHEGLVTVAQCDGTANQKVAIFIRSNHIDFANRRLYFSIQSLAKHQHCLSKFIF